MKKKKRFQLIWLFILVLVLLIIGFIGTYTYCNYASRQLHTYSFDKSKINGIQDGLSLSVDCSKQWEDISLHPDNPTGAQYDGVIVNNAPTAFKDWSIELTLSEKMDIDSAWNGIFTANGKKILISPDEGQEPIDPHSAATFGAVMYSSSIASVEGFKISGYRVITMTDVVMFRVLEVISLLWVVIFIMYIIICIRSERFHKQYELDSRIIRQSMNTFIGFIDTKDAYTRGHSVRVAEYASEIARRMNMPNEEVTQIYYISLMHDCGKIGIPDAVLQKPGKLTSEEYKLIQSHTTIGNDVLVNFTAIPGIRDGAHYHHERYDGKGYPTGLAGKDIPLCARIICVADSFDAMSSSRCYRRRLTDENILKELKENSGQQFDADIVKYMLAMIEDGFVEKILKKYPGIDRTPETEKV